MKSLVIYFSHTGENYMRNGIENIDKGNTEIVAEYIKDIVNADLFKVEPMSEYPYSYKECCDVAKKEMENNILPDIKSSVDISDYDVIYIGGPVWWGHYPCPMHTLLSKLDFSNKIVKPFTTHEGSGLGSVLEDINKYCSGATIKNGLAIRGCDAENSKNMIESWCNE